MPMRPRRPENRQNRILLKAEKYFEKGSSLHKGRDANLFATSSAASMPLAKAPFTEGIRM